jgi:hypothetical protein
MNEAMLRSYLDGWAKVCCSTPESVAAMVAGAHPEVRFTDVNSPNVHIGHDGIRHICSLGTARYSGVSAAWRDLLCDGANWSIRWTFSGDRPDGSRFSAEGASAGRLAQDGRVIEHTDYWNRAGIQGGA